MALPVFSFPIDANNAVRTNTHRTKSVQYGDGYKQLAPAGINNKLDTWDLNLPLLTDAVVAQVEAFCDAVGQHKNFNWTPPRGSLGVYRITSPIKYQANGLDRSGTTRTTVSLSIEQVVIGVAVTLPSLPLITVVANGIIGWTIARSGSTASALTVTYTLAVTPGSAISSTAVFASGSSTASVPISGATGPRTELLTLQTGSGYDLGSPSSASILITAAIGNILSLRFEGASIIDDNGINVINEFVTLSTNQPLNELSSGYFDDSSRLSVHIGTSAIGLGDFTIKTAVKFSQTPINEYIFDWGYNAYRLAWYNGSWNMYDSSVGFFLSYVHTPIVNNWYEIAICRSGVGASRTHRMYLDGVLVASEPAGNFNLFTGIYPNGGALYIGNSGIITLPSVALNGYLDNFAISDFAEFT